VDEDVTVLSTSWINTTLSNINSNLLTTVLVVNRRWDISAAITVIVTEAVTIASTTRNKA
jgi:hypothetical protein